MRNPFDRRGSGHRKEPPEQEYWLSYSDLMASLLMVFVLFLLVAGARFSQATSDLEAVREKVVGVVHTIAVRDSIISDLRKVENTALITIDTVTGTIRLSDSSAVLFQQGDARVSERGQQIIAELARDYLPVVLNNARYRQHLREVVVEGHTNDDGGFDYNMDLSQRRAFAVLEHLFAATPASDRRSLQRFLTARGRSYSEVICRDGSTAYPVDCGPEGVDKDLSRRIEIHFRLNDEEVVREIKALLDE